MTKLSQLPCAINGCKAPLEYPGAAAAPTVACLCFCGVHRLEFTGSPEGRRVEAFRVALVDDRALGARTQTALADFVRRRLVEPAPGLVAQGAGE